MHGGLALDHLTKDQKLEISYPHTPFFFLQVCTLIQKQLASLRQNTPDSQPPNK